MRQVWYFNLVSQTSRLRTGARLLVELGIVDPGYLGAPGAGTGLTVYLTSPSLSARPAPSLPHSPDSPSTSLSKIWAEWGMWLGVRFPADTPSTNKLETWRLPGARTGSGLWCSPWRTPTSSWSTRRSSTASSPSWRSSAARSACLWAGPCCQCWTWRMCSESICHNLRDDFYLYCTSNKIRFNQWQRKINFRIISNNYTASFVDTYMPQFWAG